MAWGVGGWLMPFHFQKRGDDHLTASIAKAVAGNPHLILTKYFKFDPQSILTNPHRICRSGGYFRDKLRQASLARGDDGQPRAVSSDAEVRHKRKVPRVPERRRPGRRRSRIPGAEARQYAGWHYHRGVRCRGRGRRLMPSLLRRGKPLHTNVSLFKCTIPFFPCRKKTG